MQRHALITAIGLLASLPLAADIYKTVDEDGNIHFTDNPKAEKAEAVKLKSINTQPAVIPRDQRDSADNTPEKPEATNNYQLSIEHPADGSLLTQGQQTLNVSVAISPALDSAHRLQATLNGAPFGPSSRSTSLELNGFYRGTHQLAVQVVNKKGKVLAKSKAVTLHVQRISLNSPARRSP